MHVAIYHTLTGPRVEPLCSPLLPEASAPTAPALATQCGAVLRAALTGPGDVEPLLLHLLL